MRLLIDLLPLVLLCSAVLGAKKQDLYGRVAEPIHLVCPHSISECGEIHSMKWYRDNNRIYVYSPFSNFSNAEGILVDRSEVVESGDSSDLEIKSLLPTDDGDFRCEITYMDVSTPCPSVFLYKLTTTALPAAVVLSAADKPILTVERPDLGQEEGVVGPYQFEDEVEFRCEVVEVKPTAAVSWMLGDATIEATSEETEEVEGGGVTIKSVLKTKIGREHLASSLICSVEYEAAEVAKLSLELDVILPPASVVVEVSDMTAGEEDTIICKSEGGRPAPQPSWKGLDKIQFQEDVQAVEEEDLTYTVTSTIQLTPNATDDQTEISCSVDHPALAEPLTDQSLLNVKYAPSVRIGWLEDLAAEGEKLELGMERPVVEGASVELSCRYSANPINDTKLVWLYNKTELEVGNMEEVELGEERVLPFVLENITRSHTGEYACSVSNEIGTGASGSIAIDVLYVLEVGLQLTPDRPVLESEDLNITLSCSVLDGNPAIIDTVMWFKDNDLIDTFECADSVCEYSLLGDRTEAGLYACKGWNAAGGGGEQSNQVDFVVYYTSSEGKVELDEAEPVKGSNTSLSCILDNPGMPPVQAFTWKKNGVEIEGEETDELFLDELSMEAEANYSCSGNNEAGLNFGHQIFLDVLSAPEFVVVPLEDVVITEDFQWINLTCQVECAPSCAVEWWWENQKINDGSLFWRWSDEGEEGEGEDPASLFRDYDVMHEEADSDASVLVGEEMIVEEADTPFYIENTFIPENRNQFESVVSTLHIQLGNRTREMLATYQLTNFSCSAEDNGIGGEISTITRLTIEHAPMDLVLSTNSVSVVEGEQMTPLVCLVETFPPSKIVWKRNGSLFKETMFLAFNEPIQRSSAGDYFCEASNVHGSTAEAVHVDVLYPPECTVTKELREEETVLTCTAIGNPEDFEFWWMFENTTVEGKVNETARYSYISLNPGNESDPDSYFCFVNNTAGQSQPCSTKREEAVVLAASGPDLLLVIGIVAAILVAVIILLLLAWCICFRNKGKGSPEPDGGGGEGGKGKTPEPPRPDNNFYDNLPFQGLKNPPKKVLNSVDDMVYADVDAQETYSYGPLNYRTASLQRLNKNKKQQQKDNP